MSAALHIAAAVVFIAAAWLCLHLDRKRIQALDEARDQRANAAWWRALANERASKDEAGE